MKTPVKKSQNTQYPSYEEFCRDRRRFLAAAGLGVAGLAIGGCAKHDEIRLGGEIAPASTGGIPMSPEPLPETDAGKQAVPAKTETADPATNNLPQEVEEFPDLVGDIVMPEKIKPEPPAIPGKPAVPHTPKTVKQPPKGESGKPAPHTDKPDKAKPVLGAKSELPSRRIKSKIHKDSGLNSTSRAAAQKAALMNLTLCLTHACPMACSYCYAGRKHHSAMTAETARQAVDFAAAQDESDFQLGFFGGEPLLEWDLMLDCVRYARKTLGSRKLVLTVTTNGIGLTKERAEKLYDEDFFIGFSIDGNRDMHNICRRMSDGKQSFDAVLHGLENALIHPERMETITVIDPANVVHTGESIRFLTGLGVRRISLNPNFYTDWDADALSAMTAAYESAADFLLESYRNGSAPRLNVIDSKIITALKEGYACSDRCKFGCGELAVAASGRIYPCERLVGNDDNDAVCIGTVTGGFHDDRYRKLLAARGNRDPECAECSLRNRCMNWCGCINYTTTGKIDSAPDIICFHEKLSIRVADKLAATLFDERNPAFLSRFYKV